MFPQPFKNLFCCIFFFKDRILLSIFGWPGPCYVDQAGLECTEILLLLPPEQVLGLTGCTAWLLLSHLQFQKQQADNKHVYDLGLRLSPGNSSLQAIIHHHKAALQSRSNHLRRNRDALGLTAGEHYRARQRQLSIRPHRGQLSLPPCSVLTLAFTLKLTSLPGRGLVAGGLHHVCFSMWPGWLNLPSLLPTITHLLISLLQRPGWAS